MHTESSAERPPEEFQTACKKFMSCARRGYLCYGFILSHVENDSEALEIFVGLARNLLHECCQLTPKCTPHLQELEKLLQEVQSGRKKKIKFEPLKVFTIVKTVGEVLKKVGPEGEQQGVTTRIARFLQTSATSVATFLSGTFGLYKRGRRTKEGEGKPAASSPQQQTPEQDPNWQRPDAHEMKK